MNNAVTASVLCTLLQGIMFFIVFIYSRGYNATKAVCWRLSPYMPHSHVFVVKQLVTLDYVMHPPPLELNQILKLNWMKVIAQYITIKLTLFFSQMLRS